MAQTFFLQRLNLKCISSFLPTFQWDPVWKVKVHLVLMDELREKLETIFPLEEPLDLGNF